MEIRISNYTPHPVNLYKDAKFDPSIRKYRGGTKIGTFSSVGMLNASMNERTIFTREDGVTFKKTMIVGCDPYPMNISSFRSCISRLRSIWGGTLPIC